MIHMVLLAIYNTGISIFLIVTSVLFSLKILLINFVWFYLL